MVSMAGNALAQASGIIEKAVIEIQDYRAMLSGLDAKTMNAAVGLRGADRGSKLGSLIGGGSTSINQLLRSTGGALGRSDLEGQSMLNVGTSLVTGSELGADQPAKKRFIVQFNPSELSLSGYGGGRVAKTNYSAQGSEAPISYDKMDVRIMLNVKLIFDQVDPQSAFLADKVNVSPTSLATGAVKGVMTASGAKVKTVQTQVEAFAAALRSAYTRQISFIWGKLCYSGVLNRVSSQYTMFNATGEPIRAVVELTMMCMDATVDVGNMGTWEEIYERAFAGDQSLVKASQKVGNLLNFNL